jgi:hypothetical protein
MSEPEAPPFEAMLRFLDGQLDATELAALAERLRGDERARRQAAGLLLQIGALGELAREGRDRLPARRPSPALWTIGLFAIGACLAAAVLIAKRPPVRPTVSLDQRQILACPAASTNARRELAAPGDAERVLLVRGGDPDERGAGDTLIARRLEALGFDVVDAIDARLSRADLPGNTLVVISASTAGSVLRAQLPRLGLRELPIPIVTCETATFDLLGLTTTRVRQEAGPTSGFGSTPFHSDLEIDSPGHALAAGLRGPQHVATTPVSLSWGDPTDTAIRVASIGGRTRPLTVQFAYERGTAMVGLTAPARRVGCFVSAEAPEVLTDEGWQLFDASVLWASGR